MIATLLLLLLTYTVEGQRTNPCPANPATSGYISVTDINLDIQDAVDLVSNGTIPTLPFLYPICPGSTLVFNDGDTPIQPRLDASFTCGIDGVADDCEIQGGTTQFILRADTAFKDFGLSNVSMAGIRFTGFTEASIAVFGSEDTNVGLQMEDCEWTLFQSTFVVNISSTATGDLLTQGPEILMSDCTISDGTAGVGISNDRGLFAAQTLNFTDVVMMSGIASANGALTSIANLGVTTSSMPMVSATYSLAVLLLNGGTIVNNRDLEEVFFFSGPATAADFRDSEVANMTVTGNDITSTGWVGVFAGMGVGVNVLDCVFANNRNMGSGVTASETSSANVFNTEFSNNFGTSPNVSALVLAISDATIAVDQVFFRNNLNYTSQVFTIFRSDLALSSSCIIGGGSDTVVFVSQDSTFAGVNASTNFVLDHSSTACGTVGSNRLFFEDPSSLCFQGGDCTGTCRESASSPSCLLDGTTLGPTIPPGTLAPITVAPAGNSVAPATAAPAGNSVAPATAAPDGNTLAPVGNSVAPATAAPDGNTLAPVGNTAAPATGAPISSSAAPVTAAPNGAPISPAPVVATQAPIVGTTSPTTTAPIVGTTSPTTTAPVVGSISPTTTAPTAIPTTTAPVQGPTTNTPTSAPMEAPTLPPFATSLPTPPPVVVPNFTPTRSPFFFPNPFPTPFPVVMPSLPPRPNMFPTRPPQKSPVGPAPICYSGKGGKKGKKGNSCKSSKSSKSKKGKKGYGDGKGGKKGKKGGYYEGKQQSNVNHGKMQTSNTNTAAPAKYWDFSGFSGLTSSDVQNPPKARTPLTNFPGFRSGHRNLAANEV